MAHAPATTVRVLARDDDGYDAARRDTMWNARVRDRIVQANSVDDVVRAVRAAKAAGQQISVRSGGHSWSGNHVRDGGVLLDLSLLTTFTIDRESKTATVEPALRGSDLLAELVKQNLFFPVGHCRGVGLGGFLLQGGFGRSSRAQGPACSNVLALDCVDADGHLRHASESENSEML